MAGAAVDSRDLELVAADGNRFAAFAAFASGAEPTALASGSAGPGRAVAGVVILPDVRGLHPYYEELALRFAEAGIDAVAIDYFGRTAGVGKRAEGFDFGGHVAQTTWDGLRADIAAGFGWLRDERGPRTISSVGFCFGGRLAFVVAALAELELAGVVGFYGRPVGPGRGDVPAPADLASEMSCPVLGLFGGADEGIPATDVAAFDDALTEAGVAHELVTYPGAPHSFFDRHQERFAGASADAWEQMLAFVRDPASVGG